MLDAPLLLVSVTAIAQCLNASSNTHIVCIHIGRYMYMYVCCVCRAGMCELLGVGVDLKEWLNS